MDNRRIAIIGVPMFYGCDNPGVELAPARLREMGIAGQLVSRGWDVADMGDVEVEQCCQQLWPEEEPMKYLPAVEKVCSELSDKVCTALNDGRMPFVLGGDHSHGAGTLAGVCRALGHNVAVVWVDAHSDIHSFESSPSGNIHGTPLGAAIGLDCGAIGELFGGEYIDPRNIFIIGLRSYESQEAETIHARGVNVYTVEQVRQMGMEKIFSRIDAQLESRGVEALHLSVDVDSLDPSIAPGTGIRVPGGLNEAEVMGAIRAAMATGRLRSTDISELNPSRDVDDRTSQLVMRLVAGY